MVMNERYGIIFDATIGEYLAEKHSIEVLFKQKGPLVDSKCNRSNRLGNSKKGLWHLFCHEGSFFFMKVRCHSQKLLWNKTTSWHIQLPKI